MGANYTYAIIFSLCLSLLIWTSPALTATVSIPNANVKAGTATVQISIQINQSDGVAGFQFALVYDPSILQATGWSKGSLTSGTAWNPVANLNLQSQG
jgi:hypothetical protein